MPVSSAPPKRRAMPMGPISRQVLRRINEQHITASKLEASLRDVIAEYTRFELPFLWGSGKAAIADGTHVELIENNLLGAHHVRYGKFRRHRVPSHQRYVYRPVQPLHRLRHVGSGLHP